MSNGCMRLSFNFSVRLRRVGYLFVLVLATQVLVLGCMTTSGGNSRADAGISQDELPDWYLDPKGTYPDETYLTSVGSGDSRRGAKQEALAGLSQIFEARISVDSRARQRYQELMTSEGNVSESEVQLLSSTRVESNQELLNVQFGEAAVDNSGIVHTIAYLERLPTAQIYRGLIDKNSAQVRSYLDEAERSGSILSQYAYLSAASLVAENNELLLDQLRIISPGMVQVVQRGYDPQAVNTLRAKIVQEITVGISVRGDEDGRVASLLREAISDEFFPLSDDDPTLSISGSVLTSPAEAGEGFESVRWNLALELAGPDDQSLVTYEGSDRASGVSQSAARSFAFEDIEEAVREEFVGSLRNYFLRLVVDN